MAAAGDREGAEAAAATPAGEVVKNVMKELKDKATKARKKKGVYRDESGKKVVQAKYSFNDGEKAEMAAKMAQRQQALIEKDEERKTVMKGFADQLQRLRLDISKLSRGYRDGWEHRDFNTIPVYDYKAREIRFEEVETGKVVLTQPFAPSDEQRRFI